jgi:hypothetical protein
MASFIDCNSLLTLAVLSSELSLLSSLLDFNGSSVSEALEPLKCTVQWLRYFHLLLGTDQ